MNDENKTVDQLEIEKYLLGQSTTAIELQTLEENIQLAEKMVRQTKRTLNILCRNLDKRLYDNDAFASVVSQLARRSKFSVISMLIKDSTQIVKDGHRLLDLSRKLSSTIELRKMHEDYAEYNEAFLVADNLGVIHRQYADRYESTVHFNSPLHADRLSRFFTEIWEKSHPDPELRRLYI